MEEQLVNILNEMADYLNISQMKRLHEVLLKNLCLEKGQKDQISNDEYLKLFLDAKKIEGCSPRTLRYYEVTVKHLLGKLDIPIRKMSTDKIRSYLVSYQQIKNYQYANAYFSLS